MTGEWHFDVASYAIGVLDAEDAERFEEHLVECDRCALELESLLPVSRLLTEIDRVAALRAEQSIRNGEMLDRMRNVVSLERRRTRLRHVLSAAAAVLIAVVTTFTLATGLSEESPTRKPFAAPSSSSPEPSETAEPQVSGEPGVGGPETPPGQRYTATDDASGAHLEVFVDDNTWGSQLAVLLSRVSGPLTCTLVAVDRNGGAEEVASWVVPPDGYGTPAHSQPLSLMAATALRAGSIERIEIRAVAPDDTMTILVAITL